MPSEPSQQAGGEWDPLMPESDQTSQSESDVFMEEEASQSASASSSQSQSSEGSEPQSADASQQASASGGQPDDMMMPEESASGGQPDDMMMQDDIEAAREAMQQAGIDLQQAGELLENARTDEEIQAAQQEIAKARLSVIVAGQDLLDIQNVLTDPTIPSGEEIFEEADESLQEGNVAIVIATESILDLPNFELPQLNIPGMPSSGPSGPSGDGDSQGSQSGGGGIPGGQPGTPGIAGGYPGGEPSQLDKELNESIAIFEGKILDARNEALGSAPPPTSSENVPGVAVLGGSGGLEEDGSFEENDQQGLEAGIPDVIERGQMPPGEVAKSGQAGTPPPPVPDDIPDAQGDDIVAKQLRELAIAETDPELKEKLWEEYKKYKAGL